MRLVDSFKLSINSILHRKLRSWLTLLGIVVGVAAVVAIVSVGEGAQASVGEQLSQFGADMITVAPGFTRAEGFGGIMRGEREFGERPGIQPSSAAAPTLTATDSAVIMSNPNVKHVTEIVSGRAQLVYLAEKSSVSITGVNPNTWEETAGLGLASGRYLNSGDSRAIVVGDRVANEMFKQPLAIGRRVSIGDESFTVVGILKAAGTSSRFGTSDSMVFMHYRSAWDATGVEKDTFSSIQVQVGDVGLVEETAQELTETLSVSRRVTENNQDFTITSAQSIKEQITSVTQTLTLFLGAIAAISLLVGGIGVANSMFTSVLEKTRQIGILKALGTTNFEILLLFIIESGLFGLAGGIIGVVVGSFASVGIAAIGGIELPMVRGGMGGTTLVTPQLVIIAITLSTTIGILSGLMPARAASKLKPVDALRYE